MVDPTDGYPRHLIFKTVKAENSLVCFKPKSNKLENYGKENHNWLFFYFFDVIDCVLNCFIFSVYTAQAQAICRRIRAIRFGFRQRL